MRFSISLMCVCILVVGSPALAENQKSKKIEQQSMMDTYQKFAAP